MPPTSTAPSISVKSRALTTIAFCLLARPYHSHIRSKTTNMTQLEMEMLTALRVVNSLMTCGMPPRGWAVATKKIALLMTRFSRVSGDDFLAISFIKYNTNKP